MKPTAIDDLGAFAAHFRITLYDWQQDAFGQACQRIDGRFRYRLAGISVPRGNGKSYGAALVGLWRLIAGPPPQDIISAALDYDGAKVVLDHARRIVRGHPELDRAVDLQANALVVKSTGSRWTITSREHTASRGRHATVVLYDEVGWAADDELFSSLLAGQASVPDPLALVVSTVGKKQSGPLWQVKQLADSGDDSVLWWHSPQNLSPAVSEGFLARMKRILMPAQYAREHMNSWVDSADSFTSAAEVDRAMGHGWTERLVGVPGTSYVAFIDLGVIHDATVIAIGHADGDRAFIDRLVTLQGSREEPVQLATVEQTIKDLATTFSLTSIRIESWQGMASAQSLVASGLPVALFTPTAKAHAEEWPILAQRLAAGTLVLPPHARLREELLNLVAELGPQGMRVVDRSRGPHQDHAVAVRGVVAQLVEPQAVAPLAAGLADEPYEAIDWDAARREFDPRY